MPIPIPRILGSLAPKRALPALRGAHHSRAESASPTPAALSAFLKHNSEHQMDYSTRDLVLYNIAIGALSSQAGVTGELHRVWEAHPAFAVVPSWLVVPAYRARADLSDLFRDVFGNAANVLLSQRLAISNPLPMPKGDARVQLDSTLLPPKIYSTTSKKHSILETTVVTRHNSTELARNTASVMLMNRTFDGVPIAPSSRSLAAPSTPPDITRDYNIPWNGAALFRLSLGDTNAIHIDPEFCKKAGFRGPLLHGVCLLGYGMRTLLDGFGISDGKVGNVEVGFKSPVIIGDAIQVACWEPGNDGIARFVVKNGDKIAVQGVVELRD